MYFVAVVLPPTLNEKILVYKKWMREKYGCKVGLKSPAHITLIPPFWMQATDEQTLKNELSTIASSVSSFSIATKNFSAFKPRTIFIGVAENDDLKNLKETTDARIQASGRQIKIDTRPFHPHITIATRDLHKKVFAEAWQHFEEDRFEESFTAQSISLLKHNGQTWDVTFNAAFNDCSIANPL